ncbi:hypothetical protein JRQ81_013033 [Phrynocephalus forsythii]|uniref:Talin 1 n=1 Tax=Phrynocephalus forsythii TaxID=171643 RepID=A0A9Q0XZ26_9SAUR|nr:hypothetical protein JRQ81_013033 [Phrynocephalus forsythii]
MVALSLKISIGNVVKTMQFEPSTMVYDACRIIRERVPEAQMGQPNDFGLFLSDEDPKKGIWLEAGKALDYYMLRNGDTMEYKKKQRPLKIRMLDGTVKTVMVDDSKTVTDMLMTICARIGITNYDEYSLVREMMEEKKEEQTGTLKKDKTLLRDEKKMEKLKQKLHTDDELNWLDHGRTLREQGVDPSETLLLRRKFFYSDQNVDSRDPVQLNLLYVQARDDILNGSHPVSFDKACEFAGYQCQVQFGPHNEQKHKPGFLDLKDFLPKEYIKQKGERKIFMAHKNCGNMSEIEAKVRYVKLARSLKTYGVSFFLVKALHNQMLTAVQEISHLIEPVACAARAEASQLGHKVSQLAQYFEPLVLAAVGAASKMLNHQQQMNLLDQTKTLAESALQMLYTAKEAGGNPKQAPHTQEALDEVVQMMKEAVEDLTATLNEAASAAGVVGGMVDSITQAINQLDEGPVGEPDGSFVDYQTTMVKTAKAIAVTVQEMVTKSTTNPDELGTLANQLTMDYGQLAQQAKQAALTAENEEIGSHIKHRVQELGHGCAALVTKAGALQCSPSDAYTKKELIECARRVSEKVSHVLAALQAGNRGTQACITAASAVSGIIADLDTTIMFATAGTLNRENAETFADHREGILKTAKALVEDTKVLVQNATASQEKLAQAAQSSVATITRLAEVVKLGAASLGSEDPETQVVLINAVKDVAKALGDLISATKAAAGKAADDPAVYQLKNSAKVMVTNVTSLLKTVKAVEDEATKGTRALEATIEHIRQELAVFCSQVPPAKTSTPEDFIRMTKGITMATAKAVAAGNSCRQEDVIATANLSRRAIADMLRSCKEAAYHPEVSGEVRHRALRFGQECARGYLELLEHVLMVLQKPSHELKQQLAAYSKRVAGCVTELIQAAEAMKGTEWVDPEDPTVIAENELLGAAAAIEAAAKKLEQLQPRAKPKQADESLNFEEQILEAAKSIAAATSALVKAASAAQRELVAQGKVGAIPANALDDGQWSQGLISAARMVAAATNNLCEAANAAVQGHASEEKLISSAKQVAASTAQLLVACKVKADQDSEAMKRLQAAGNAVKRASDHLVKAAQKAAAFQDSENETVVVKERMVVGIAQIIAAQEEMLRKERELEEARKKLAMIRQQQYKFLPSELRDEGQN